MNLKLNLKLHLASRRLTASELSRLTKVPKATLSDWLSGRSPKNLNHLKAVADIFKINIDDLVFGDFSETKATPEESLSKCNLVSIGRFDVYMKKVT